MQEDQAGTSSLVTDTEHQQQQEYHDHQLDDTEQPAAHELELLEPLGETEGVIELEVVKAEDGLPDILGDGSSDELTGTSEGSLEWSDLDCDMKRIKVYELVGSRWVDQGTALCFGHINNQNVACLTARSEKNFDEIILQTAIRANDVYQRQQETLIVWTEPDGVDYALSFQDPDGCAEVWGFIQEVQKLMKAENDESASEPARTPLPSPQLGNIAEIERNIKQLSRTQLHKERICEHIQREKYIKQLIEVLSVAEDLEAIESLHALCSLVQTILMLNDHGIYEHILDDDLFQGVIGMLEYDPEFPRHKANYREFLNSASHFHQPIAIQDQAIQRKIHHTYRLQFLKDVVLARVLDDSTLNVLNSCIIFNQIDIITHVQSDIQFLREVVRLYVDEEMLNGGGIRQQGADGSGSEATDDANPPLRREVIHLIQQLCAMGKNVQLPARLSLFRSLVDRGILFAVQWALSQPESHDTNKPIINAGGEILSALLDHDIVGVRGHILKHVAAIAKEKEVGKKWLEKAETLLQLTCKIMATSHDLATQSQIGDALRSWLDVPQTDMTAPASGEAATLALPKLHRKDDPGTERFMEYFYQECVHTLFKPLIQLPEWKSSDPLKLSREQTNRFVYLCDLLCNFTLQHNFRSHFFVISSHLCAKVPILFRAKDKHLRHASFRFFRQLLRQNNPNMLNQIIRHDALQPILDLTISESKRDNLLSCCCQEYFEHIRRENLKDLIKHCMTKHEDKVRLLAQTPLGSERFQLFIQRWEMNNEPLPPASAPTKPIESRLWPSNNRPLDADEESYFNTDDDDDIIPSISQQPRITPPQIPQLPSLNTVKRKRRMALANAAKGLKPTPRTPSRPSMLDQLSDYSEDDEETIPLDAVDTVTSTPTPSARKPLPSLKRKDEDDDEDNLLANIMRRNPRPESPAPGLMANTSSFGGSMKRRREEDEEDLNGLVRSKKFDLGTGKDPTVIAGRTPKIGDDPPAKKIKLQLTPLSVAAAAAPSVNGGDNSDSGSNPSKGSGDGNDNDAGS